MEWEDLQELRDHNMERRAFDEQGWLDHEEEVSAFLIQSLKLTHADGALVTGLATQMQFYSLYSIFVYMVPSINSLVSVSNTYVGAVSP